MDNLTTISGSRVFDLLSRDKQLDVFKKWVDSAPDDYLEHLHRVITKKTICNIDVNGDDVYLPPIHETYNLTSTIDDTDLQMNIYLPKNPAGTTIIVRHDAPCDYELKFLYNGIIATNIILNNQSIVAQIEYKENKMIISCTLTQIVEDE